MVNIKFVVSYLKVARSKTKPNLIVSGVYVKLKGKRDSRCSLLVANYVSALDSLAASHALGTISVSYF